MYSRFFLRVAKFSSIKNGHIEFEYFFFEEVNEREEMENRHIHEFIDKHFFLRVAKFSSIKNGHIEFFFEEVNERKEMEYLRFHRRYQ